MDVQESQEIETFQSNKTDIENTKKILEAENTDITNTTKPLETGNTESDNTEDLFEPTTVAAEIVKDPVTNEDFEKENEEKSFENDTVDTENTDKRQKRYRSEKQRERTRQYKKKIRRMKRKMMSEIQKEEMCGSVSQITAATEVSLISSEQENQFVKSDPLLKGIETFPASGKVSNLNASAEVFVPNTRILPEENVSALINNDTDKVNSINTCDYGIKATLAEQLETIRQYRLSQERMREEKYNEIVRNMAAIIPFLTTHLMASSPSGGLLTAPNTVSKGYLFTTVQTDAASPRYSQQRFVPDLRKQCKRDNQTKRKGIVFLPSARNVPESLRISANSFLPENRQRVHECHARTVQFNSSSRLQTSEEMFQEQTTYRRLVNDKTFESSTDVIAGNNLQDAEVVLHSSDERFLPFKSKYQAVDVEESVPSVNRSTGTGINAVRSTLDIPDPTLIYTDSRDITSLETAVRSHKQVSPWLTKTDIFSQGIVEHQSCSYKTRW